MEFKYLRKRLKNIFYNKKLPNQREMVTLDNSNPVGMCLVSYDERYIKTNNVELNRGHSSKWESREIALIFSRLGYNVDIINWQDNSFIPQKKYNIIFDIHHNLSRLAPYLPQKTIKLLHSTGSFPEYAAHRELDRVDNLIKRKKKYYSPKRICDTVYFKRSAEIANAISLFGTEYTKNTFPEQFQNKITLLPVTFSLTSQKDINQPLGDEFLWFYGSGAVHKGLDILLDIFLENQNYKLNVVGNLESEKDFMEIYNHELKGLSNIEYHGFLDPLSDKFKQIIQRCFAFIAPSCSESTSTAAVTCLIAGLYPIYSIDNGVTLPDSTGYLLKNCSHEEIWKAIRLVSDYSEKDIKNDIKQIIDFVSKKHSRENFTFEMTRFLKKIINRI